MPSESSESCATDSDARSITPDPTSPVGSDSLDGSSTNGDSMPLDDNAEEAGPVVSRETESQTRGIQRIQLM
jgi:hypothetical protein